VSIRVHPWFLLPLTAVFRFIVLTIGIMPFTAAFQKFNETATVKMTPLHLQMGDKNFALNSFESL
jgi:hypothetical protein